MAGKRTSRPSGATPTQFMPAPATTPTPQVRSLPVRRTAKTAAMPPRATSPTTT